MAPDRFLSSALVMLAVTGAVRSGHAMAGDSTDGPARSSFLPQQSAAMLAGIVGRSKDSFWETTDLALGLKYELMWFREDNRSIGLGPFVETRTRSFHNVDLGGGLLVVLPIFEAMPLWLNASAFGRAEGIWEPGAAIAATWGVRSVNFHSSYGMGFGIMTEARVTERETNWTFAASIDLAGLALPFIMLGGAIR